MKKFFWADQIAEKIINEKGNKKEYVCASGITPSGFVHIGNFREVITTELVVKALKDKGKKARFIYSWDDFDRFRKIPANLPEETKKEYEKYIGMPLGQIPSPFDKKKNYAEYFEKQFEKSLEKVGVDAEFINQNFMNQKCKYASLIKKALDKTEDIKKILNKYRKCPLPKNWFPITVYSKNTGKDDTKIINVQGYEITYEDSTGFKETIDYRKKGLVKLKWRIDWPARWYYESVDFEPGGIDHSVEGGSFATGKEISKKIFDFDPPLYVFYDWVRPKGGREFSSSSGNATTLNEVLEVYDPEVLRYLFVGTRPNKGFEISFDKDIIKIYDEYDSLESKYYQGIANPQEKRIYELSQIKIQKKKPEKINFRHLITLVQVKKINEIASHSKERAQRVKNWLENYAEEDMKFEIQEKVKIQLTEKQKQALILLKETLATKDCNEDQLYNEFYNICNSVGIKTKEFFQTAYEVLINKSKGPRLASLILSIDKKRIIKLLEQIK